MDSDTIPIHANSGLPLTAFKIPAPFQLVPFQTFPTFVMRETSGVFVGSRREILSATSNTSRPSVLEVLVERAPLLEVLSTVPRVWVGSL